MLAWCKQASEISRLFDPLFSHDLTFPASGFRERREVSRVGGQLEDAARAWWTKASAHAHSAALASAPAALTAHMWPDAMSAATVILSRVDAANINGPRRNANIFTDFLN